MTKREIASLAIKLMGVFILIKSISYVPMAFGSLFSVWRMTIEHSGVGWAVLIAVLSMGFSAVAVAFSLSVIVFSDKIAEWLIKKDEGKVVEFGGSLSKEDIMVVVFTCIGLYLMVSAVPSIIFQASNFLSLHKAGSDYAAYWTGGFSRMLTLIAPVVQIVLGAWLFAGSKGIVKLWKKIRS